ncbi:recombinase family protein [Streptomyces europaeiscabiei]|uniref:recombinase family protein n=1 Tax=Streptomyces europaeiscabiei TaxID=146819 RepID=UPI002E176F71
MGTVSRRVIIPPQNSIVKPTDLIPVLGYARVSTWREEMISVDIQKSVVEEAAIRRGRFIAHWIVDPDNTGRNFKRRIMQGIEAVEQSLFPEIWVWKFSRFGRNRYGVAINLARIENAGGELISATEDIDASTAVGEFTRDMLFAVAAFESNRAGEQWKETHELRRAAGLPATGRKRFGYRWHPRRIPDGEGGVTLQDEWYEVMPERAEIAHAGYERYIRGQIGFASLAQWWTEAGFVNSVGQPWQDQAVKTYLDSGFAAGLLRVHRNDIKCPRKSVRCWTPDHWEYRPAEHESIITGDEWDAYRDRREQRKGTPRRSLRPTYPLSGLVFCGVCRENQRQARCLLHANGTKPHLVYYRCGMNHRGHVKHGTVRVRRDRVERAVQEWLQRVQDEIDAIVGGRVVVPQPRTEPSIDAKRTRLQADISKYTGALERATEAYALGDIPREAYLTTRDKLTAQHDEAQRELDALGPAELSVPTSPVPHRETIAGLLAEWDTIGVASKRFLLARLIRRVELGLDHSLDVVPTWAPADEPLPAVRASSRGGA